MTSIHPNSMAAYASTMVERESLDGRILKLMADGKPRTDRQIQRALDHPEPLRPRVNELLKDGQLFEVGSTVCDVTGKTVRLTQIRLGQRELL
jgi:hypothetical protein